MPRNTDSRVTSKVDTVIPAEPGWKILSIFDGKFEANSTVIAWIVHVIRHTDSGYEPNILCFPVTAQGDGCGQGLIAPDGSVEWCDGWYPTLDAANADLARGAEERQPRSSAIATCETASPPVARP